MFRKRSLDLYLGYHKAPPSILVNHLHTVYLVLSYMRSRKITGMLLFSKAYQIPRTLNIKSDVTFIHS